MNPAEVRRIESGRRSPGVEVVVRLAQALDVEPKELFADIRTSDEA
jgi:transcriptional regulator with XRE-family HTH domain